MSEQVNKLEHEPAIEWMVSAYVSEHKIVLWTECSPEYHTGLKTCNARPHKKKKNNKISRD